MKKYHKKQVNTSASQLRTFVLFACLVGGIVAGFALYSSLKMPLYGNINSSLNTYKYPILIVSAYIPIFIFYKLSVGLILIPLYLFMRGITCSCAMLSMHQAYLSDSMLLLRFGLPATLRLWGLLYFSSIIFKKSYNKLVGTVITQDGEVKAYFNLILIIISQIICESIILSI